MKQKESLERQIEALDQKLSDTVEHQQREAKFAQEANERFQKNIQCFEKFYPDIAKAIQNYQVREDFCLHVTTSGHGNLVPKGQSSMLYSQDPVCQSKEQVEKQLESPVYSLTDYTGYPKQDDGRIHSRYMTKLALLMTDVKEKQREVIRALPDSFPTAIIFGTGLGYHVPILMEKAQFDYTFIVEPDFEIFFGSLFCTNWYEVIEKVDEQGGCLFFHLGADHETLIKDLEKIAEDIGAFSLVRSFCYQHTPGQEVNVLIRKWCSEYFRFQFGHGFYNDAVTGLAHSIHHIKNGASILTSPPTHVDLNTPIFIVGNGPSLDEAEQFIKNNQNNAIIVASGTAIASLHKKGINADFHVLVERPYDNYKIFGEIFPAEEYKKVNLLGLNMLYPDTNARYKWSGIAVKGSEAGTSLMDLLWLKNEGKTLPKIPFCNPVVANTALSFFLYFGFKNIYLLGIDNGKALNGVHHSKDSIYKFDNRDKTGGYSSIPIEGRALPGNLGGTVISNDLFMVAHAQLEKLIEYYSAKSVINVGSGAKITGAIATAAEDLIDLNGIRDKGSIVEDIKKQCFSDWAISDVERDYVAIDKLEKICDHLISIANEPAETRFDELLKLRRQSRYMYSFRDTVLGHLFHVVKGSMLYFFCPMITLLYSYKDDEFTMESFKQLNSLWIDYITEIKDDYPNSYDSKCDWEFTKF
jgi:hypothetical protein